MNHDDFEKELYDIPGGKSIFSREQLSLGVDVCSKGYVENLVWITRTDVIRRKDLEENFLMIKKLKKEMKETRLYEVNRMPYHDYCWWVAYIKKLNVSGHVHVFQLTENQEVVRKLYWIFKDSKCRLKSIKDF